MLSFLQFLKEASSREKKGWVHSKTGKTLLWTGVSPYHVQYVMKNLSKFRLNEKDVMDILEARYDRMDAPNPKHEAEQEYSALLRGASDVDRAVELLAVQKGWCRIVLGRWCEIAGYDLKQMHQAAKQLDKNGHYDYGEMKALELYNLDEGNGPIKKGYQARYNRADVIENSYDVQQWIGGRSADPSNIGKGRTEIGSTMAMFRT